MRTLMIAGLAMVTAIAVTPAESQRLSPAPMAGGQVVMGGGQAAGGGHWSGGGQVMGGGQWSGGGQGQAMPRPPMNGGMPHGPGANYPAPQPQHPPMTPPANGGHWQNNGGGQWSGSSGGGHWQNTGGGQWSGHGGGHWSGGTNAPGGWNAYHRPTRGWSLPRYWIAPSFYISDYGSYGLSMPPAGYGWSRYYDDAVLIDGRGRVADTAYGVDWDGNGYAQGGSAYASDGYAYAQGGAAYSQDSYQAEGAGYAEQAPPPHVVYRDGQQGSYSSYSSSGGYVSNGYYFPPATTTVVTVQSAPVVTTTTTEYVETYRAARRVYRPAPRPVRHRVVRRACTCACGCR
jgi:Ni/Co efflux regulator RcnB